MQKCKNANFAVLSRRIVPYRSISFHIAPYRSSRKKNVVPLHQKNVDGGSTKSGQQQSFPTYPKKVGYHITSVL